MTSQSWTYRLNTPCGNLYLTITEDNGDPLGSIIIRLGKAGGCAAAMTESLGVLLSWARHCKEDPKELFLRLKGIQCHRSSQYAPSCIDSVVSKIVQHLEDHEAQKAKQESNA